MQTQTYPVTVSNAVSGRLETVPVTFRCGATNGLVERFDGARFVPVQLTRSDDALSHLDGHGESRVQFIRRLQRIQLPAITSGTITLSNAVELIAGHIRRADGTGLAPVRLLYRCCKGQVGEPYLLPLNIPATNAFEALRYLSRQDGYPLFALKGSDVSAKHRDEQTSADPFSASAAGIEGSWGSVTVFIRDGCVVVKIFGAEDWYCSVMRQYEVPSVFFKSFAKEHDFTRFASERLGLVDELYCQFVRALGKLRVSFCGTPQFGFDEFDQLALFEEQVLEPLVGDYSTPQQVSLFPCVVGNRKTLFARASNKGCFLGVWRYEAVADAGGLRREGFEPCALDVGMVDDEMLELRQATVIGRRSGWLRKPLAETTCWALTSHDGARFRFEEGRFRLVLCEPDPEPLYAVADDEDVQDSSELFKGIVVPALEVRNEHLTNGLLQVQAAIDASPAPTNRLRVVFNSAGAPEAVTNMPALSARFINVYDALKLLTDVSGLRVIFSDRNRTAELLSESCYTQRLSRCRTYRLPQKLCERMPARENWEALLADELHGVVVDAYRPVQRTLVLRSAYGKGGLAVADRVVDEALVTFPGRFTLENKEVGGRVELLLTDTYRDIVRRYRSGVGKDGKRWERFEVVR